MTVVADAAVAETSRTSAIRIDWALAACIAGAVLMVIAAFMAIERQWFEGYLTPVQQRAVSHVAFAFAITWPVITCWLRAIRDSQLPARFGGEPRYEHVSGWSAIFLAVVVAAIAVVVWWAAQSDDANRKIHELWGLGVVAGLTLVFVLVACASWIPRITRLLRLEKPAQLASGVLNAPIKWLGQALSVVDSFFVFAVANAAGTNRQNVLLRYGVLLGIVGACAALGYLWKPPFAFVPIAWGFLVAFAVSRRWAWIENDRELAMLNPTISRAHIRVGFDQNLRDEALVAFLSMFLLVPLALRQAQAYWGTDLFTLAPGADVDSLQMWLAFYGTELAKAVPFVDWAEVYHVEGAAAVSAEKDMAQHAVFLTRVLVDLVFLAALLQAISSASRDAKQRDLFYLKQSIHHLDPFTEPDALRALVSRSASGEWQANDKFEEFPRDYDANRLVELSAHQDERIRRAADFLLARDGVGKDPHHKLSATAATKDITPETIKGLLDAIEGAGSNRNAYQLALARRRLLSRRSMADVRLRIVTMMTQAVPSVERTEHLIEAMVGEQREAYQRARGIALEALAPDTGRNLRVRGAIRQVADHDGAQALRKRALTILEQYPETPD